ncbi:hypothetical protein [Sphingobium sp.]|uniref:hypothetical protein n=1 Tax=Sphingobium sp. TaxID=1912891 RepID=UPI002614FE07|nr:hypothetical protein [Sphingobium sp.]
MPGKMGFSRVSRRRDGGRIIFGAFRSLVDKLAFLKSENRRKSVGTFHFPQKSLSTFQQAQISAPFNPLMAPVADSKVESESGKRNGHQAAVEMITSRAVWARPAPLT